MKSKKITITYSNKQRLLMAMLTSLSITFIFMIFGPIDIYANNKEEFPFVFYDFILPLMLVSMAFFIILTGILYLFKSNLLNIITSIIFSALIIGYIDNTLVNKVMINSGDISTSTQKQLVFSSILYIVIGYAAMFLALYLKENWRKVVIFLTVLLVSMNSASLITDFVSKNLISDDSIDCNYVLSNKDLLSVSEKENIIYILFDRFDTDFYNEVENDTPEFFDSLEGFTYYDNATSVYSRTFPGVPYMITGEYYTGNTTPQEYFSYAYKNSKFLTDLKNNGYSINIYADKYYEYDDGENLLGVADNVQKVDGYTPDKKRIVKYLTKLSFARKFTYFLSSAMYSSANNGTVTSLSKIDCQDGTYADNDTNLKNLIDKNGLNTTSSEKSLHLFILMALIRHLFLMKIVNIAKMQQELHRLKAHLITCINILMN